MPAKEGGKEAGQITGIYHYSGHDPRVGLGPPPSSLALTPDRPEELACPAILSILGLCGLITKGGKELTFLFLL